MLKTHYIKGKLSVNKLMPSNIHGIVYNQIPDDKLSTKDDLIRLVLLNKEARDVFYDSGENGVSNIIDDLVKLNFVGELHGNLFSKVIDEKLGRFWWKN